MLLLWIPCTIFTLSLSRWLAELGPMFFTIKELTFSQKDAKKLDILEGKIMEAEIEADLKKAKLEKEAEALKRAGTELILNKSQLVVTPGMKRPSTDRPGTGKMHRFRSGI